MKLSELDTWWSSLTTVRKERIGSKIATKKLGKPTVVKYPDCTDYWLELDDENKQRIHDHCIDEHGYFLPEDPIDTITFSY
ncbi:MAG: hypothetical protein HUJ96_08615 [Marinilabiliaceae bacterium]|nr:hypothetical protein [Marinilabiliaceae bacterium]